MAPNSRARKTGRTRLRAIQGAQQRGVCRVPGCPRSAPRAVDGGLQSRFCKPHREYFSRHGSLRRGTYRKAEIDGIRRKAYRWLKRNIDEPKVRRAAAGVEAAYLSAGIDPRAHSTRGLSPAERAKAQWARMRDAGVDPLRVLAAYIAVAEAIRLDPQADLSAEFRRVQAAKVLLRMASGTHGRWEQPGHDGHTRRVVELHFYPKSRGHLLRHLGREAERLAEPALDAYRRAVEMTETP